MLSLSIVSLIALLGNTVDVNVIITAEAAGDAGGWVYDYSNKRENYVVDEINRYNQNLTDELAQEKYQDMNVSAFNFYRGTNHLYWKDIGQLPGISSFGSLDNPNSKNSKSTRTWLSGDAHINNMGTFSNSDDDVVFDLNDFDESLIADYQYDLWRMATSIVLVLKSNGFSEENQISVIDNFVENYLTSMERFVGKGDEHKKETIYNDQSTSNQLQAFIKDVAGNGKVSDKRKKLLKKYTKKSSNPNRIFNLDIEDLAKLKDERDWKMIDEQINSPIKSSSGGPYVSTLSDPSIYTPEVFKIKDIALRLHAGIGSQGTSRYYVLIEGASDDDSDDIILDIKVQSSPSAYINIDEDSIAFTNSVSLTNPGRRVVLAARALGQKVDKYLGYMALGNGIFTVRERNPYKKTFDADGSKDDEAPTKITTFQQATSHFSQIASILAAAHARADVDASNSGIEYKIENNIKDKVNARYDEFQKLVRDVAFKYAKQVEFDYKVFYNALKNGTIPPKQTNTNPTRSSDEL